MSHQGRTSAFQECNRFASKINEYMFREHGFPYLSPDQQKGEWRKKIPYTPEIEADVIKFAANYINMQISNPQLAKLKTFVTKLVGIMADYISKYSARNPEYKCREQAIHALTETLTKKSRILTPMVLDDKTRRKRDRIISAQAKCTQKQIQSMFERATHFTADYSR